MSVPFANPSEFTQFPEPTPSDSDPSVLIEVEAVAAPDTLSRLLEPLVVLQITPSRVDCVAGGGGMMKVRIALDGDRETAERLLRKFRGAVVVSSANALPHTGIAPQANGADPASPSASDLKMPNT